jgi:SHS2 domain-containing protein
MEPFKIIDHEADIGFEIYGKTLEELFHNAAFALFSLIVEADDIKAEKGKKLEIKDSDGLLIVFLNELLYFWETEGFIPRDLSFKIANGRLSGKVIGGLFNPDNHIIKREIKAATYHRFSINEENGMLKATVILDI